MQYEITLPADYDMAITRERVATCGHALDDRAGLGLKAYLIGERGAAGSPVNQYAPFYLWQDAGRMGEFLVGGSRARRRRTLRGAAPVRARPGGPAPGPGLVKRHDAPRERVSRGVHVEGRCGGRLLGEMHNTAPAERYSVKAVIAARGTQTTSATDDFSRLPPLLSPAPRIGLRHQRPKPACTKVGEWRI
ncbi:DUF4865 family protein [Microbispora sp. NPDC046933]|uniref:DUF4865 family protein n=1 Tax=Microbispora sp. NPDC046933 TaxID=3155618 RepID=UPI0033DA7D76